MTKNTCAWAFVAVMAVALSGCSTLRHDDVNLTWDDLPVAVQSTVQGHSFGGTVDRIEKDSTVSGDVYEVFITGPGEQSGEVKVASDGKLLNYRSWKNEEERRQEKAQETVNSTAKE